MIIDVRLRRTPWIDGVDAVLRCRISCSSHSCCWPMGWCVASTKNVKCLHYTFTRHPPHRHPPPLPHRPPPLLPPPRLRCSASVPLLQQLCLHSENYNGTTLMNTGS